MNSAKTLAAGGVIAALYAVLCILFAPIAFGPVQFRIAEGLTVLPYFHWVAIPGLFIGCAIANLFSPFGILDGVVGSLATLIAASGTWLIGKKVKPRLLAIWLAPLPPAVANGLIIGGMLAATSGQGMHLGTFLSFAPQVFIEELLVCYILGLPLIFLLERLSMKKTNLK
jgi:uncharacterized membrane protein